MNTKALRQKILDLAIRGKLVPQDPNDEPASVLLERIREEKRQMVKDGKLKAKDIKNDTIIFKGEDNSHYEKFQDGTVKCIEDEIPFKVPEGWGWARVVSVASIITDGEHKTPRRCKAYDGNYLLSARNIQNGHILLDNVDYVDKEEYLRISKRCNPRRNDVLISCSGSVGRVTIVEDDNFYVMVRSVAMIRFIELNSQFEMYVLQSWYLQNQIQKSSKQTAQSNLFQGALLNLLIPVPPADEQQKNAKKIAEMFAIINTLENDRISISQIINRTKSKILDLAIRGKLVSQNPDDEPASVLLEHIHAEKEELIKQGIIRCDKKESAIFRGDDNSYYEKLANGTTKCINSELPFMLPDKWRWERVRNIFIVNPKNEIDDNTQISFIPMASIENGYWGNYSYKKKIWKECKKGFTHFAEGDICFAKISPCFENRKSAIFKELAGGYGAGTTELYILRPYTKDILPEYVLSFVKSEYFINRGKNTFSGVVGQQRVDKDVMLDTFIPIPPITTQSEITNNIRQILEELTNIESSLS